MQSRHVYGVDCHARDYKVLLKGLAPGKDFSLFVDDKTPAVKDELVLAAYGVVVGDNDLVVPGPCDEHLFAERCLSHVIGRGVYVDDDLGSGQRLEPCRPFRGPDVLAYLGAYGYAVQDDAQRTVG